MDTLQFHHDKHNGYTYAVDVSFNRDDLLETIHRFDKPVTFMIGNAIVHPNDNYCKATGREVSAGKMKPTVLSFLSTSKGYVPHGVDDNNRLYVRFIDKDTNLVYTFRVNILTEKVHFIQVN